MQSPYFMQAGMQHAEEIIVITGDSEHRVIRQYITRKPDKEPMPDDSWRSYESFQAFQFSS
jgi:hypothetical protein